MYLSVCKKDFNGINVGQLFDTYQEVNYAFIREKGSNQKFKRLPLQEYSTYFTKFRDCLFLPTTQEEIIVVGLFKKKQKVVYKELQEFLMYKNLDFDELNQMQLSIFEPIDKLSKVGGIGKYTGNLYKVLKQIEDIQKMGFLLREDIQGKIKKAEVIVKEIEIEIRKQL